MARGGVGTVTVRFLGDVSNLTGALGDVEGKLGKTSSGLTKTFAGIGKLALGGGTALAGFGAIAVKAFSESEQVAAQTAAVLKSTGGAAGATATHIGDLAGKLSMLSGADDEVIQSGENVLLTFTNIRNGAGKNNDIFDQATAAALDMSTALGTDLSAANIQLGKALNDPIKGVTALSKVGVSFTAKQKEQIKTLVESGHTMEAQKIILKELSTEFGGSAKAAGDTFAGKLNKLKVIVGNFTEEVGARLVPIIERFADIIGRTVPKALAIVKPWFDKVKEGVQLAIWAFKDPSAPWTEGSPFQTGAAKIGLILRQVWDLVKGNLGPVLAGLGAIVAVAVVPPFIAWAAATVAAILPVLAIAAAIGALVGGIVYAYQHFEGFRKAIEKISEALTGIAGPAFETLKGIISKFVEIVMNLWDRFGGQLLEHLQTAFNAIVQIFTGVFEVIKGVFQLFAAIFTGDWKGAWEALKTIFSGIWDIFIGVFKYALNLISLAIGAAMAGISAAWGAIWHGLATLFTDIWVGIKRGIGNALDGIVNFFKDMPGRLKAVASGIFDFIKDAFKSAINWVIRAWNGLEFKIPGFDPPGPGPTFGGFTIGVPNIPQLGTGAIVRARPGGILANIGEGRYDEAITPLRPGMDMGGTVNNYFYIDGALDPAGVARQIQSLLLEEQRRSGPLGFKATG